MPPRKPALLGIAELAEPEAHRKEPRNAATETSEARWGGRPVVVPYQITGARPRHNRPSHLPPMSIEAALAHLLGLPRALLLCCQASQLDLSLSSVPLEYEPTGTGPDQAPARKDERRKDERSRPRLLNVSSHSASGLRTALCG